MKDRKMTVTLLELRLLGACKMERKLFKELFGRSAEITAENMKKAVDNGLFVYYYAFDLRRPTALFQNYDKTLLLQKLWRDYEAERLAEIYGRHNSNYLRLVEILSKRTNRSRV